MYKFKLNLQNKFEIKLKSLKHAKLKLTFTKKFSLKSKLPNLGLNVAAAGMSWSLSPCQTAFLHQNSSCSRFTLATNLEPNIRF